MLSIVIVGVGGQGTLLASRILGMLALTAGMDVKVSEVHGMSQRGGSVITHVRMGDCGETVRSPLVEAGGADFVLAFERLEALRALSYLKPGGMVITSTQAILPMPVITGAAEYPGDALDAIKAAVPMAQLDAQAAANEAGSPRSANVALIGVLARYLPFGRDSVRDAVAACVPERTITGNLAAFDIGYGR